jgi:nucleotide-binding universal stress UspA family protein
MRRFAHHQEAHMYRSILVPLDGSPFGEHALPPALAIAQSAAAYLHLAHVHGVTRAHLLDTHSALRDRAREREYLDQTAQQLASRWDGPITTALLAGTIALAVHDYAVERRADLVVLTTHGRGPLSRFWLGSVADRLVRWATMPLLLVRPHERAPDFAHPPALRRILIPLDGSALAERIFAAALELGRPQSATYTLLQVVEPVVIEAIGREEQGPQQAEAHAWAYLEGLAAGLRAEGLEVATDVVVAEHPAPAILAYAQQRAVDLIAVETHGRGGITRVLLGSVADKLLRGATTPVLLHRPPIDQPAE